MSSQESSGSSADSKLNLSLSQETVDYMWHIVSDVATDYVWSVVYSVVLYCSTELNFL